MSGAREPTPFSKSGVAPVQQRVGIPQRQREAHVHRDGQSEDPRRLLEVAIWMTLLILKRYDRPQG